MSNNPEWHTDGFPELRSGPPWVMEEMIQAGAELPRGMTEASDVAGAIGEAVLAAARAAQPIVLTGCGTSEHGAMAVAELLDEALRRHGIEAGAIEVRQALEAAVDPRRGGLCLAVSHDGATRATVLALDAARAAGARTALITAQGDAPAVQFADHVLRTPLQDRSWCHTVAYLSAILAGAVVAGSVSGITFEVDALEEYLRECLRLRRSAESISRKLNGVHRLVTCGMRADCVSAREMALKIEEGPRLPAVMHQTETLLHGHLAAGDAKTGVVMVTTDPRVGGRMVVRLELALQAVRRIGMPAAAILSHDNNVSIPIDLTPAGRAVLPEAVGVPPLLAALAGSAIALQLITLGLIHHAGVNPDLIRREDQAYREAADIAEDDGEW